MIRSGATGPVSVSYATANDSALPGSDYLDVSGVLTFAAGETSKTFLVPVLKNPARKVPATVILTLEDPATDDVISSAELTIVP